jgi:hypothetical protein
VLSDRTISGVLFAESCHAVVAGNDLVLAAGADATFAAGGSIVLQDGFAVEAGAAFTAELDPSLPAGVFMQDDRPSSESTYHTRFFVNVDGATIGAGDQIEHFVAYDAEAESQLEILVRSGPSMVLAVRDDTGTFHETSSHSLSAGWNEVLVSWEAATDATPSLQVNACPPEVLPALDNEDARIEFVRWGVVGGTLTGSSGVLALDDFTSWR